MNKNIGCKVVASTVIASMLVAPACTVFGYSKDETVYTKTKNDGSSYKTIVTEHLKNTDSLEDILDSSVLNNIQNTNGDESFSKNDNTLVWKANGNDIYYQGETDKELPISMKITYKLDGNEISATELAGKSGKLEIEIEFTNNEKHTEYINGKYVTMYTPFAVVSGTVFNNDKVKNMTITNGKVIDNGTKSIVVGLCMPGMQESLGINKSDFEIPENITITADATDFEMGSILTYASPKVIEDSDIKNLDKINDVFDKVDELSSASKDLVAGTETLNNGVKTVDSSVGTLNEGANELADGTNQLADGTSTVATNMKKITTGASDIVNGEDKVLSGLNTIQEKLPSETEIETKKVQLNYLKTQNTGAIAQLKAANATIDTQLVSANSGLAKANEGLLSLKAQGIDANTITSVRTAANSYKQLLASGTTLTDKQNSTILAVSLYDSLTGTITLLNSNITSLTEQKAGNTNLIKLLTADEQTVEASLDTLDDMTTLNSGVSDLKSGTTELKNGATELQTGSTKIQTGVNTLATASKKVQVGANALADGTTRLKTGTTELASGSQELTDGMTKFDSDGIQKIAKFVNTDLKEYKTRLEKLRDLANEYVSYAGSEDGNDVVTKFITVTDEIKKNDDSTEEQTTPSIIDNSLVSEPEKNDNTTSNTK